jgi:chorismate dehydratase
MGVNIFGALSGELSAPSRQRPARSEGPGDRFAFQSSQVTSSQASMRISAISYLNTAPLMWDFEHGEIGKQFQISYTIPSKCAVELEEGTADIGIIPSFAYARIPDLRILPGVAIASKNPVRSILLVSPKPIEEIQSVALDQSSLTSVALVGILFQKYWPGGARKFTSHAPNLESMLLTSDAALLIGDPALKVDRSQYRTWDLAEEWIRFTGKPFVFAFWAVRESALKNSQLDLATIFQNSRDHGLEPGNLDEIARAWASKLGLGEDDIRSYLTSNIHYFLDDSCLDGLRLFYRYANECGLLPEVSDLRFADSSSALISH